MRHNREIFCGGCRPDCDGWAAYEVISEYTRLLSDLSGLQQMASVSEEKYRELRSDYEIEVKKWLKKCKTRLLGKEDE